MKFLILLSAAHCIGAIPEAQPAVDRSRIQTLVRQLDDARFAVRHKAEHDLCHEGLGVVPLMQQELQKGLPLEVRQRVERVINHYSQIPWHLRLDEALAEAKKTSKPIFVMTSPAMVGQSADAKGNTFNNLELAWHLKQNYILVWNKHSALYWSQFNVNQVKQVQGRRNWVSGPVLSLNGYFCTSEGMVVCHLNGKCDGKQIVAKSNEAAKIIKSGGPVVTPAPEVVRNVRANTAHMAAPQNQQAVLVQVLAVQNAQITPNGGVPVHQPAVSPVGRSISEVLGGAAFGNMNYQIFTR